MSGKPIEKFGTQAEKAKVFYAFREVPYLTCRKAHSDADQEWR
jgi:hypothetical protein